MDLLKFGRFSIVAVLVFGGAGAAALGQTIGKRVFSTSESCELGALLTAAECRNAHANALAELDEKSPRFTSRAECEKNFNRCMIAGIDRKRVEFEPAMRGFEVNVRSENDKTVMPVVDGASSMLGFHSRTALRPDPGISRTAQGQARARWAQAQKARAAAAEDSARALEGESNMNGGAEDFRGPTAPRPETSAPTAYDRAAEQRRREEIRRAATIY
jgi:uncharacterized protein YgiB involved in biofilm formation